MEQGLQHAAALGPEGTVQELARAGLRDRDYEGLPTASRLQAHRSETGEGKRLVCDCVDTEPGLEINGSLLASQAEAIVEGALIAAFAASTQRVTIHVGEDDHEGAGAVAEARERMSAAGEPGGSSGAGGAFASGPAFEIVRGPFKQNLKGYEDVPTLVLTGETLANISRILRDGADKYREDGTPESPGAKLFQVSGPVRNPGIFELPLGIRLRQVIEEVCGGLENGERLQAVVVGGAKGAFYKEEELGLLLDFDSVRDSGGVIGSGSIEVLSEKDCAIDRTKQSLGFGCYESCGKCSLGREGSYQLREIVADMTRGRSRAGDLDMLREIGRAMRLGCACPAGRTAPNLVLSGMEKFPDEYEAHMKRKRCRALVCEQYVTFHILPDLCDGCGACVEECPEDAIEGGRKEIHVINQDSCTKCARCFDVCGRLQQAVVKAGPVKPRTPRRPIPVGGWKT